MNYYGITIKKNSGHTPTREDYGRWMVACMKKYGMQVSIVDSVFEYGKHNRLHVHGFLFCRSNVNPNIVKNTFNSGWHIDVRPLLSNEDIQRWMNYLKKEQEPPIVEKARYEQYLLLGAGYPFID